MSKFVDDKLTYFMTVFECILFHLSLIPVSLTQVRDRTTEKISYTDIMAKEIKYESLCEKIVFTMKEEYLERKKTSLEKVNVLFRAITLVFTLIVAIFSFVTSKKFLNLDVFIMTSFCFVMCSLLMILLYYKVSEMNKITFPKNDEEQNTGTYIKDMLFCIESNSRRLDFLVTAYKSSLRYLFLSIVCLIIGLFRQMSSVTYL